MSSLSASPVSYPPKDPSYEGRGLIADINQGIQQYSQGKLYLSEKDADISYNLI